MLLLLRRPDVSERILATRRSALVAYWPLWEPSGSVAFDQSGNGRNGAYTGVALGQPGLGDGQSSVGLDGSTSFGNIYSTSLRDAFTGQELTLSAWVHVNSAATYADATERRICTFRVDASNQLGLRRLTSQDGLGVFYTAGGTAKSVTLNTLGEVNWLHVALTASKSADQVKGYLRGVQVLSTLTGLGTWAGLIASTTTVIGAASTVPATVWHGRIAHLALWNVALTAGEIAMFARR